jgi:hypothetical protein
MRTGHKELIIRVITKFRSVLFIGLVLDIELLNLEFQILNLEFRILNFELSF